MADGCSNLLRMEKHRLSVDVERVLGEPSYLEDSKMPLSLSSMPVRAVRRSLSHRRGQLDLTKMKP
jgi:hypothetical protein